MPDDKKDKKYWYDQYAPKNTVKDIGEDATRTPY